MDGLDEFEKSLAAEKAERERSEKAREERRHHKHRHHRHDDRDRDDRRHRRRHHDDGDEGHRHKRSRRSRGDSRSPRRSSDAHAHRRDGSRDRTSRDKPRHKDDNGVAARTEAPDAPVRDAWMTTPSAIPVEHVRRPEPKSKAPSREEPKRVLHSRELNHRLRDVDEGASVAEPEQAREKRQVDYTFGDSGSSWRLTKLRGIYTMAESSGRSVDDVAVERYGSLQEFDDAREEKEEMERRNIYGPGFREKDKPTGDLYRARKVDRSTQQQQSATEPLADSGPVVIPDEQPATTVDPTQLNRLRAQMMKAKLRKAPNAAKLEEEYNRAAAAAAAASSSAPDEAVVLSIMDNRQLAGQRGEVKAVQGRRGRERGLVEENNDMSIEDMVREERRTKNQAGGEGLRLAERIAKDAKFDNDLSYLDDNAERLARRVHKSEVSLKNMAVHEVQKMQRILDRCPLCHDEENNNGPSAPVVSLATRVFATLPPEPEVSPGGAVIVPLAHRTNLLECDDDEWEEMRNFMKALTRMYHHQGREVLFYENAAAPHRRLHAAMVAVPIPYDQGATAPAFFREALASADDEWSQHRKIIDTRGSAGRRMAFRGAIAKEMPYFHVWFSLDGGYAHVVENADRWPRGDLFAREVIGAIVGAEPHVIKKQGRWTRGGDRERVDAWKRGWTRFDWTRVLQES